MDNCIIILEGGCIFVFFILPLAVATDIDIFILFFLGAELVYNSVGYSPPLLSLWSCIINFPPDSSKWRDVNSPLCITRGTGIQPGQDGVSGDLTW